MYVPAPYGASIKGSDTRTSLKSYGCRQEPENYRKVSITARHGSKNRI